MLKPTDLVLGLFSTAAALVFAGPSQASISEFIVYHSYSYTQDGSGLSAAVASVQAQAVTSVNGEFDGGTMTAPDGTVVSAIDQSSVGYPFGVFGGYFGPQPFGAFTVNLSNSMTLATDSASLSYTSDHYPNVAPQVSNYSALQHFNPTLDNSIILTSGFNLPVDATGGSTTFFIFDLVTDQRLLQYSLSPDATVFDVPAGTAVFGEPIGYYFEFDIDYESTVDGVVDANVYRDITTGEINAAPAVPEASTWSMMLAGFGGLGLLARRRRTTAAS
jgi:PEP-CTERM motif